MLGRIHFAVPHGKFVFQVTDSSIDAFGERFVWKFGLIRGPLHKMTPREEISHPPAMLRKRMASCVIYQVFCFPRSECGANFVPIINGGMKIPQHSCRKISKLAYFQWEAC